MAPVKPMTWAVTKKQWRSFRRRAANDFHSIASSERQWPVRRQCQVLGVSPSGSYAWKTRKPGKRAIANQNLLHDVFRIYLGSGRRYGSRKVYRELKREGQKVGKARIEKLMQANDLHSITRKRIRIKTTDSNHNLPVAANVIDRNNFGTLGPNEKWYRILPLSRRMKAGFTWPSFSIFTAKDRRVGHARSYENGTCPGSSHDGTATAKRRSGFIHHSDRGSQYASHAYQQALQDAGAIPSMSRKGKPI